jgi:hypothetical protein
MIIIESCWEIEPRIVKIADHECVVCRDREQGEEWVAKRIMEKRREILKELAKLHWPLPGNSGCCPHQS